jgi:hypothetical protein
MLGAATIEVGAERDSHGRTPIRILRGANERVKERRSLIRVWADREDLFELIDREHDALARPRARERVGNVRRAKRAFELGNRMLARPHQQHAPPGASGQNASRERRQHARAQDRRFAASRGADDPGERATREPGNEVGDDLLTPEEIVRVAHVEEGEPLERAHDDATVLLRRPAGPELKRRVPRQDRSFE